MRPYRLFYLILITLFSTSAKAQTGGTNFYLAFDQFFQNYYMINPASSDSSDRLRVSLGNIWLTGLFQGVSRMYFDADFRPGKRGSPSFSRLGIFIKNSNDGAFINRSRYYGRYNRTVAIGKNQAISLGLALGLVNYRFKGSYTFAGGSATAFDGNAGIWYLRKNLKAGISLQQFSRSIIQPSQERFQLNPIWNFNLVYSSFLSSQVQLTNNVFYRKETGSMSWFEYAPVFLFNETLQAGADFELHKGVAILLGVKTSVNGYGKLRFMGSFLISTHKFSSSGDNKFEISAGYSL